MATIDEILNKVFISPLVSIISAVVDLLPQALLALLLILITYSISHFIGVATRKFLYKIKIDNIIRARNMGDTFGATSLAAIYSQLVKLSLFVLFSVKILGIVNLGFISGIANALIFWLSKVVFTVTIIITGLVLIDFFTLRVLETKTNFMRNVVKPMRVFLIVVLVFTSLEELGLRLIVAENIFMMVVGAALFAAALALGIGFGLALKDDAKRILKQSRKTRK
jgi:hypothetical protein